MGDIALRGQGKAFLQRRGFAKGGKVNRVKRDEGTPDSGEKFIKSITPRISKGTSVSEGTKTDSSMTGLSVNTKAGEFTVSRSKADSDDNRYKQKQKEDKLEYRKEIPVGEKGKVNINASVGKANSEVEGYDDSKRKQTTKGGGISYTHSFKKGGSVKKGILIVIESKNKKSKKMKKGGLTTPTIPPALKKGMKKIGLKDGGKPGLWANINARKKAGTSRSKSESTISPKAYANMKAGFPKKGKK